MKRPDGSLMAELRAAAVAITDECIFLPSQKRERRTSVHVPGEARRMAAARMVWILAEGDPGDQWVLHTCHRGDEGCVNRRHLYLGDQSQNMRDMWAAGRSLRGGGHRAKLTEAQVREIRRRFVPGKGPRDRGNGQALAAEFGIAHTSLKSIVNRNNWAWLE